MAGVVNIVSLQLFLITNSPKLNNKKPKKKKFSTKHVTHLCTLPCLVCSLPFSLCVCKCSAAVQKKLQKQQTNLEEFEVFYISTEMFANAVVFL